MSILFGTRSAGVRPRADDAIEFGFRDWHGLPRAPVRVYTGFPAPCHELVFSEVVDDLTHALPAVALAVDHLAADLARALALPGHRARREMPRRCTRNAARIEVARLVTGI